MVTQGPESSISVCVDTIHCTDDLLYISPRSVGIILTRLVFELRLSSPYRFKSILCLTTMLFHLSILSPVLWLMWDSSICSSSSEHHDSCAPTSPIEMASARYPLYAAPYCFLHYEHGLLLQTGAILWSILREIAPRYMTADVTVETGIAKVLIIL